jgi:hypothetical protein
VFHVVISVVKAAKSGWTKAMKHEEGVLQANIEGNKGD